MSKDKEKLLNKLVSEGDKTVAFFEGLDENIWHKLVYTDGETWSVYQVFSHIVQAEDSILRLVEEIVKGAAGVPEDFALDKYNARKVAEVNGLSQLMLLDLFSERRNITIKALARFSDADLEMEGRHPFLGMASVGTIMRLMYQHTQLHQRDIRRIIVK